MNISSAIGNYAAMSQPASAKSAISTAGEIDAMKRATEQTPSPANVQPFSSAQVRAPEGGKGNTLSTYA